MAAADPRIIKAALKGIEQLQRDYWPERMIFLACRFPGSGPRAHARALGHGLYGPSADSGQASPSTTR